MIKYHVSEDGVPRRCTARAGACPLGDEDNHYSSIDAAQRAFESYAAEALGNFSQELPFPLGDRQLLDSLAYLEASQDLTFARNLHREMRVAHRRISQLSEPFSQELTQKILELMDESNDYPEWGGKESLQRLKDFHTLGASCFRQAELVEASDPRLAKKLRSFGRAIQSSVQRLTPVDRTLQRKEQLKGVSYLPVTERLNNGEN